MSRPSTKISAAERQKRMDDVFAKAHHAGLVTQKGDLQYIDLFPYYDSSQTKRYTLAFDLNGFNKSIKPYNGYSTEDFHEDEWLKIIEKMVDDLAKEITTYRITKEDLVELAEELEQPAIATINPDHIPEIAVNLSYWYDEADVTNQTKILSHWCKKKQPVASPNVLIVSEKIISVTDDSYQQEQTRSVLQELIDEVSIKFTSSPTTNTVITTIPLLTNVGKSGTSTSATGESATSTATSSHGHHQRLDLIFTKTRDSNITCQPIVFDSLRNADKNNSENCKFFDDILGNILSKNTRIKKLNTVAQKTELQPEGPQCSLIVINDIEQKIKETYATTTEIGTTISDAADNTKAKLQRHAKMRAKQYFRTQLAKHLLDIEIIDPTEAAVDIGLSGLPIAQDIKIAIDRCAENLAKSFKQTATESTTQRHLKPKTTDTSIASTAYHSRTENADSVPSTAISPRPELPAIAIGDEMSYIIEYDKVDSSTAHKESPTIKKLLIKDNYDNYSLYTKEADGNYSVWRYIPELKVNGKVVIKEDIMKISDTPATQEQLLSCCKEIKEKATETFNINNSSIIASPLASTEHKK